MQNLLAATTSCSSCQYHGRLRAICRGYARDEPESEDLLQDVLVTVWRKLDTFRGEARFLTWLYRVAVNTCLMHRRRPTLPTVNLDRAATLRFKYREELAAYAEFGRVGELP